MIKCTTIRLLALLIAISVVSCKNSNDSGDTTLTKGAVTTASFKVWGNCEMCKETIEGALKVEGVRKAEWNAETKQVQITYDTAIISLDQMQKNIAAAGYDNEKYKSDEKAYGNLPECCQYERK